MTSSREACTKEVPYLNTDTIFDEEKYDRFYAVCTSLEDMSVDQIIRINKKRWEIEECFRIMKTEFKTRPVFLQREDLIKAHFLICFIALFILSYFGKEAA